MSSHASRVKSKAILTFSPDVASDLRHRCRRCKCKLPEPTDNLRNAFCTRGCFTSFYRSKCLVCEAPFKRTREDQHTCGGPKCQTVLRRDKVRFFAKWGHPRHPPSLDVSKPLRNPIKPSTKSAHESGRAWHLVAGPPLDPVGLRLATLPLDPELAARLARAHAPYVEYRRKTKPEAELKAIIKRHHPPVNVLGGYRFPNAPVIDLSPIKTFAEWAAPSRWTPVYFIAADVPDIPDFLRRNWPASSKLAV